MQPGHRPSRGDLVAGLSVGLVLIPQSLAYAVLAGMPPERGLVVAIAATIAAAPFASSPYLQTGPVAITALLTLGALESLAPVGSDAYVQLGMILALLVGAIRLAIGLFREGALAYLLSRPVLAGFTPAAALVIAASQVPLALGVPAEGQVLVGAVRAVVDVAAWDLTALAMAVASTAVLVLTTRRWPLVPSVVVVVVAGILVERAIGFDGELVGTIPGLSLQWPASLPWGQAGTLLGSAFVIAVVGFGDVAAVARIYAAETRTAWDANREFVSQGVANLASGLVGGFPAGGSFSRSAIGRLAGATTTWSGALAGLVVLAFLPFTSLLEDLPLAVLAGIIIASVLKLLPPRELLELRHLSRPQFLIALLTGILTLVLSPSIHLALLAGIGLAVAWHLRREMRVPVDSWVEGEALHLRPHGVLYFGSAHVVEETLLGLLADHPTVQSLVLHLDRVSRLDVTAAMGLRDLIEEAGRADVRTSLTDARPHAEKVLRKVLDSTEFASFLE